MRTPSGRRTRALVKGAVGSSNAIASTLNRSAPLICAGLGVTLAFRAGLFNIGAQGQLIIGALCAAYVGFTWNLPPFVHLLVALVAGLLGGAFWGGLVGFLKARTGAHEVITTIMFNYLAASVLLYALSKDAFRRPGSDNALSPKVDDSAAFPRLSVGGFDVHSGVLIALLAGVAVWWLLERSTWGFELRAVGANAQASRTAGMSVSKVYTLAMLLAGLLAGLAGDHAGPRQPELAQRDAARLDRLRRDHRGPARPGQSARHGAGRPAVRCDERRRRGDAGQCRHAEGAHRRPPGTHRALRGRAGPGQGAAAHQGAAAAGATVMAKGWGS